jgi:glycosyltransferase involved in cell wall biosynthesis
MIKSRTISLIIPCRNEAESLKVMLNKVPKGVDEVIVVDNGSTDETAKVAKAFGARLVKESRIDRLGIGYGFAHQKGIKKASGDLIVTMDGDGTYPLWQIGAVVKYMEKQNLDFVACSRFPLTNHQVISAYRKLGVFVLNAVVRGLYRYPIQDILSGMWVIKRDAVSQLQLKEGGWDFSPEIKLNALMAKKIRFGQYHIRHYRRENGASKQQLWVTGINHLKYIIFRWILSDNDWVQSIKNWRGRVVQPIRAKLAYLFS